MNSENSELSRESHMNSSSTSISNKLLTDSLGSKGKEREEERMIVPIHLGKITSMTITDSTRTLGESIKESYGISHKDKKTISELNILSKYEDIVDEMETQRCFILSYLTAILGRHQTDKTVKLVISILVKRKLLHVYKYEGMAKSTFGLPVYYTSDAREEDLEDTLREYKNLDELRFAKQEQRKKKKVTPEEIVEHNEELRILSKKKKSETLQAKKDKEVVNIKCCDYVMKTSGVYNFQQHTCGKGWVKV